MTKHSTGIDRLKAIGQLGVNLYALFGELFHGRCGDRERIARMFGRTDVGEFCDDVAQVLFQKSFRAAVTAEIIETEATEASLRHVFDRENGWVREAYSQAYFNNGTHCIECSSTSQFRIADDEGQFQEATAFEFLKFLNSIARKAVVA